MITLGIETATSSVSVALAGDDGVLAFVEINGGRRHAEVLTPAIEFACKHAQIAVGDIGAIGVDIGPGLFTGMRVGIATAKAMAMALQVPLVGVCSLDLLAHPQRGSEHVIASVIDARKGEVFFALYLSGGGVSGDGEAEEVRRVAEPTVGSIADFNAAVLARGQHTIALGDGAWRYRAEIDGDVTCVDLAHPSAASLVHIARVRALRSGLGADGTLAVDDVHPMYLRAPDAQINWTSR